MAEWVDLLDPTEEELRQEIANLKGRLTVAERKLTEKTVTVTVEKAVEKVVEIPAVDAKTIKAVHQVVWNIERAAGRFDKLLEMKAEIDNWCGKLSKDLNDAVEAQENARRTPVIADEGRIARMPAPDASDDDQPEGELQSDGEPLSRPQIAMLRALREFNAIDIDHVSRPQLAGWLGKKVTGSFLNDLSRLKTLHLVEYYTTPSNEKAVILTNDGLRNAPKVQWQVTPDGVFSQVLSAVTGPQQAILKACRTVFPKWIGREELAEKLQKTVSGTFLNDLSRLHTSEMIEYGTTSGSSM